MDQSADEALRAARFWLRSQQRRWAQVLPPEGAPDARSVALAQVDLREARAVPDGDDVLSEGFRFPADSERRRWERTREIIRRIDPGPCEDGVRLAILARQAATIELTLLEHVESDPVERPVARALERIIMGTTAQQRHDAVTSHVGDAAVITLSDGMMSAYYQSAKAVVLAWPELPAGSGSDRDGLSGDLRAVSAALDRDAAPTLQLEETLGNWFYSGRPRPMRSEPPRSRQRMLALDVHISCMERFVLAHEYVHALWDQLGVPLPAGSVPPRRDVEREIRADIEAARIVMASAAEWDHFAPNLALQGAPLAVRVHEIVQEALAVAGRPEAAPAQSHPPLRDRRAMLVELYRREVHADGPLDIRALMFATETVDELWSRARVPLSTWLTSDRPFHPTWGADRVGDTRRPEGALRP